MRNGQEASGIIADYEQEKRKMPLTDGSRDR
jgi:hypothetical protein